MAFSTRRSWRRLLVNWKTFNSSSDGIADPAIFSHAMCACSNEAAKTSALDTFARTSLSHLALSPARGNSWRSSSPTDLLRLTIRIRIWCILKWQQNAILLLHVFFILWRMIWTSTIVQIAGNLMKCVRNVCLLRRYPKMKQRDKTEDRDLTVFALGNINTIIINVSRERGT